MIEIKHKITGKILHTVNADTLQSADLRHAELADADLSGTNLSRANLSRANLSRANLSNTDMTGANLDNANLSNVDLSGALLNSADLSGAIIRKVDLTNTVMSGAKLRETTFSDCRTLHQAKGLEFVQHRAPSSLDIRTIRACVNDLPDMFLLGVGYTNEEIEILRTLYQQEIVYYSCFLSHGSNDMEFAERLRADLLSQGVNCWHHRYDLQSGDYWRKQVNAAINQHDKLIVICSKDGLLRANVVEEILEGMEQEQETQTQKLFPIRLDDFIFSQEMEQVITTRLPLQQRENWIRYVRQHHTPDFSRWKDHEAYQTEFKKLLKDLKHPQQR